MGSVTGLDALGQFQLPALRHLRKKDERRNVALAQVLLRILAPPCEHSPSTIDAIGWLRLRKTES
jgi:hypothetical protein